MPVVPDRPEHVHAAHPRQAHVEQDQVGPPDGRPGRAGKAGEGRLTVGEDPEVVAQAGEAQARHQEPDLEGVVLHQRHGEGPGVDRVRRTVVTSWHGVLPRWVGSHGGAGHMSGR